MSFDWPLAQGMKATSPLSVPATHEYTACSVRTIKCVRAKMAAISSASSTPPKEGAVIDLANLQCILQNDRFQVSIVEVVAEKLTSTLIKLR